MADVNLSLKDGAGTAKAFLAKVNSDSSLSLYHVEDGAQRTALLAALAPLSAPLDTVIKSSATDRGLIVGFTGAVISTTNASTTITLTTAPTSGGLVIGQIISAAGIPVGSTIASLASGTANAVGATYTISAQATATGSSVAATSVGPQQMMASNANRRGISIQNQSDTGALYISGAATATPDYHSLRVKADSYYETPTNHSGTGAISVIGTVPAMPIYGREW